MSIDLERVDAVIERTGVSYKEAKEALDSNNGDVVEAIIFLEEKGNFFSGSFTENVSNKGDKIFEKLKEILKEGNVNKITVKKDGEIIANIPVNVGVVGFALQPLFGALGLTAAILTKHTIEITKKDGEVIDLKEATENYVAKAKSDVKTDTDCDDSDSTTDENLN